MTGVSLSPKTSSAEAGEVGNRNLNATIQPENATDKSITFKTEEVEGLSVSNAGKLEWTADTPPGVYTTTVTTNDGGFTDTHTLTLTESEEADPIVEGPESIEISPKTHTFIPQREPGAQKKLTVTILPEEADQGYTFESSDKSIADTKIHGDVYGLHDFFVTAESPGTATITVTSVNGLTASCTVTIPEQD